MIHIRVDTESDTPVYVQIMDQLRAIVRQGALAAGAPLPPVRQLAADLELNPNTVAKAYSLLEREGVVRTARRRGTFVAEGGAGRAGRAADRRLHEAIDRVAERAADLDLDAREVVAAMARRLERGRSAAPSGGEHS